MPFDIIVACKADDGGIGKDGGIPWSIKADMKHFREITTHTQDSQKCNAIIMGRNTWESLNRKPLPNRINIVISRTTQRVPGAFVFPSLDAALAFTANETTLIETTFVIGGQALYNEALTHRDLHKVYLTRVYLGTNDIRCDRFFPIDNIRHLRYITTSPLHEENGVSFTFSEYYKSVSISGSIVNPPPWDPMEP